MRYGVFSRYEISCPTLGFRRTVFSTVSPEVFFEKELPEGGGAAFSFVRPDGLAIRLSHEPVFSRPKKWDAQFYLFFMDYSSEAGSFLEAQFPDGKKIRWVFDAKYRISSEEEGFDLIPDDAINQMHRYRDALIYLSKSDDGEDEKSRPVLGAFVLYPGWVDEKRRRTPIRKHRGSGYRRISFLPEKKIVGFGLSWARYSVRWSSRKSCGEFLNLTNTY